MPRGRTYSKSRHTTGPRRNKLGWRNTVRAPEVRHKTNNNHGGAMTSDLKGTLCSIEAGTGRDQRSGTRVRLLNVRGFGRAPQGHGSTRIIIYIPKATDDTLTIFSNHDAINPAQFHVLYDKYWVPMLNAGNDTFHYNISFGRNGKIVEYDGSLGSGYITPTVKYLFVNNDKLGEGYLNSITTFTDE